MMIGEALREVVRTSLEFLVTQYWGGILFIVIGINQILANLKKSDRDDQLRSYWYYAGWIGAFAMVVLGIVIVVLNILGEI